MTIIGHLIQGQINEDFDRLADVYNPSIGTVSKQVSLANKATVEKAIDSAQAAFPAWRNTPPAKRAGIMFRFKELLEHNIDTIVKLIGEEHGKISHDASGEIQRGIENVEYACSAPQFLKGEHSKNVGPAIDCWSESQALGVVAGITPFNFPAMVPLWMYPLAIVCGDTFILKPSERNPSCAIFIAELLHKAGLPAGVLNVVNGDKEAVDTLVSDKRIQAISFVGSTPVAEDIYSSACVNGKRCQALGGAKNHAVVMPDADLDNAVEALTGAAFGSSGERCMAISVAITIGETLSKQLVTKMKTRMKSLSVGAYTDNSNDFGPLISQAHLNKVNEHINKAQEQGATIEVDGRDVVVTGHENGFFINGTLINKVNPSMSCYKEEIFGPVLVVVCVETLQQAMQLIDEHEYGNGTCIFTRDGETARYFSDNINVGMVGINVPLPVPTAYHSFGGWKRSLFGDLHAYGPDAVRFYTKRKSITQRWPSSGIQDQAQFSFPAHHE